MPREVLCGANRNGLRRIPPLLTDNNLVEEKGQVEREKEGTSSNMKRRVPVFWVSVAVMFYPKESRRQGVCRCPSLHIELIPQRPHPRLQIWKKPHGRSPTVSRGPLCPLQYSLTVSHASLLTFPVRVSLPMTLHGNLDGPSFHARHLVGRGLQQHLARPNFPSSATQTRVFVPSLAEH